MLFDDSQVATINGEQQTLSGIDLQDLSDIRHTVFHEWTHIMERCVVKASQLSKEDIINNCLAGLKLHDKNQLIMIGDAPNDAKSASQVGIPFLGVTYGYGFKTKHDVDCYPNIGYLDTVQDIIKELNKRIKYNYES